MLHTIWSPDMSTGVAAMDDLQCEFCDALARVALLPDEEFPVAYRAFIDAVELAFAKEEEWMEEIEFPALRSHLEQHARVLSALHNTHSMAMAGDLATARKVVEQLLPDWFSFHAGTMNLALAMAMRAAEEFVRSAPPRPEQTSAAAYA